jgi:hypothetical protein
MAKEQKDGDLKSEVETLRGKLEMAAQEAAAARAEAEAAKVAMATAEAERQKAQVSLAEATGAASLPANSPSTEVQEFWLTGPRYLQQVGESYPRFLSASIKAPKRVKLPKWIYRKDKDGVPHKVLHPEDRELKRIMPKAPVSMQAKAGRQRNMRTGASPVTPVELPDVEDAENAPATAPVRAADQ